MLIESITNRAATHVDIPDCKLSTLRLRHCERSPAPAAPLGLSVKVMRCVGEAAHFTDADGRLRCSDPTGNPQGLDLLSPGRLPPFSSPLSASLLVVCLLPSSPSLPDLFDSSFVRYPVRLISPLYLSLTSLNSPTVFDS